MTISWFGDSLRGIAPCEFYTESHQTTSWISELERDKKTTHPGTPVRATGGSKDVPVVDERPRALVSQPVILAGDLDAIVF